MLYTELQRLVKTDKLFASLLFFLLKELKIPNSGPSRQWRDALPLSYNGWLKSMSFSLLYFFYT
jgi:hypothetical protein